MPSQRDPDTRAQARLDRDPGAPHAALAPHHQPRYLTVDTDPTGVDPAALATMLATVADDDPRYIAARLAIEIRQAKTALREVSHAIHAGFVEHAPRWWEQPSHDELEHHRSTFNGRLDRRHLALRADPDHGRARRRRAS
jgi:hypothetical protein